MTQYKLQNTEGRYMEDIAKALVAWYTFEDGEEIGTDRSGKGHHAKACGTTLPQIMQTGGRSAAVFAGGANGSSYIKLPNAIRETISDDSGFTISAWVYAKKADSVWERIVDFGAGERGPYLFLTRCLRGVCFAGEDLAADAGYALAEEQWSHVVFCVHGTKGGTESSAGPRIYVDGELVADGMISQTSSGNYRSYRAWWDAFCKMDENAGLYIGRSQFGADPDFCGAISDFRIYDRALEETEILSMMCSALSEAEILKMADEKFMPQIPRILTEDYTLPVSLMDGRISVRWGSQPEGMVDVDGIVHPKEEPTGAVVTAELCYGDEKLVKEETVTIMPLGIAPTEIIIHGNKKECDISSTLYGLFFEDINHSVDGGIYAELVQNRSFEEFTYDTYDARSGENGISTGRRHDPLKYWFGDLDGITVKVEGGLRDFFGMQDADANAIYIEAKAGTTLINHGFCDENMQPSMPLVKGETYLFSVWAKSEQKTTITVVLENTDGQEISEPVSVAIEGTGVWKKYEGVALTAQETAAGQLALHFAGDTAVDMVSLMPEAVWGANKEQDGECAHSNYLGNPNYRLRRDLVQTLKELKPAFLRFPGGCISEGSYIWDNVYDWKDSVGAVECRKENYNVWGYTMTMGVGYMEYFQLAEDLGAMPLPVMACGVLCQARSDYANPAGGALREKYIQNFIDLIDFAISIDFTGNKWAALRRKMGHEMPFELHYLGVGNENWGTEFMANFEEFYEKIDAHMKKHYPWHELHIVSTAGAQADDDAYQNGWRFLAGGQKGSERIAFTDGTKSWEENVSWYPGKKNYLDTIVDEHYYRSNAYLLENADRYDYYYRPYADGKLVEDQVSKVFVGEYASTDKNTLEGAVAEAAVMTGFEKNSDVVRLAATAPLFNKTAADGTYRWTPDCIWFDNEKVWRTPNYYVQQMFAANIGTTALKTTYATYVAGRKQAQKPHGDAAIFTKGRIRLEHLLVTDNETGEALFEQDFKDALKPELNAFDGGYYLKLSADHDSRYTVTVAATCLEEGASFSVAAGIRGGSYGSQKDFDRKKVSMHEYCIGVKDFGTGLKVYKDGKEGYTMGDYSSSVYAGNLRRFYTEELKPGTSYVAALDFGGASGDAISGSYKENGGEKNCASFAAKLSYYNRDIFHSVTVDEQAVYVKLVNPAKNGKRCRICYENLRVSDGTWISLAADNKDEAHTPNINRKEGEPIQPRQRLVAVEKDENGNRYSEIVLPESSVHVLILPRR